MYVNTFLYLCTIENNISIITKKVKAMTSEEKFRAETYMKYLLSNGEIIERAAHGYMMRDTDGEVTFISKSTIDYLKEGLNRF